MVVPVVQIVRKIPRFGRSRRRARPHPPTSFPSNGELASDQTARHPLRHHRWRPSYGARPQREAEAMLRRLRRTALGVAGTAMLLATLAMIFVALAPTPSMAQARIITITVVEIVP